MHKEEETITRNPRRMPIIRNPKREKKHKKKRGGGSEPYTSHRRPPSSTLSFSSSPAFRNGSQLICFPTQLIPVTQTEQNTKKKRPHFISLISQTQQREPFCPFLPS
jgi:hypothetical protein